MLANQSLRRAKKPHSFSFSDAERAHGKWKARLINYINGRSEEELDEQHICQDNQCDLGQWIYGDAKKYARLKEYDSLRKSHAAFHQSVGEIVCNVKNGDVSKAKKILGGDFAQYSKQTIQNITQMKTVVKSGREQHDFDNKITGTYGI